MKNNKWCLLCGILTIGLILALSTTATARDAELGTAMMLDEGAVEGGMVTSGPGAIDQNGQTIYSMQRLSGYFFPLGASFGLPTRDYDDIMSTGGGELILFEVDVFGSGVYGGNAGNPGDVRISIYTDTLGNPADGFPDQLITSCDFIDLPPSTVLNLQCKVAPGITVPDNFWLAMEPLGVSDNFGWLISDCDAFLTGNPCDVGISGDFWANETPPDGGAFGFFFFGGCNCDPADFNPCSNFIARVVVEGQPWGCCDPVTNECINILETKCDCATQIFTQGVLCNDQDPPCSKSGACCNKATGACANTFESECQGFADIFTAGASCSTVECNQPDNVPTVTQWGMIVLSVMLVAGLTIKFGRRRTATA